MGRGLVWQLTGGPPTFLLPSWERDEGIHPAGEARGGKRSEGVQLYVVSGANLEAELTSCSNANLFKTRRSVVDKDSFELKVLAIQILNSEIFNPSAAVNTTSIPIYRLNQDTSASRGF